MKKYESSQNLMSLTLKTKKWCNYVPSRRFGKYSFKIDAGFGKGWGLQGLSTGFDIL
jgi:hypothetical protein